MAFGLFNRLIKKKDPICGMKQEKGKGMEKDSEWFCSAACLKKFEEKKNESNNDAPKKSSCCGH